MQPYFFPYIGYYQLLYHTDIFVFYDDVNFIKQGWINRNRILINHQPRYLTVPCSKASSYSRICQVRHAMDERIRTKLLRTVCTAYRSAPYFKQVFPLFQQVIEAEMESISGIAAASIRQTCRYLDLKVEFKYSSQEYANEHLGRADRLIDICRNEQCDIYVNSAGGRSLYNEEKFASGGIQLQFLAPDIIPYRQFGKGFVPGLSILDIMMFNSVGKVREMLQHYHVV